MQQELSFPFVHLPTSKWLTGEDTALISIIIIIREVWPGLLDYLPWPVCRRFKRNL